MKEQQDYFRVPLGIWKLLIKEKEDSKFYRSLGNSDRNLGLDNVVWICLEREGRDAILETRNGTSALTTSNHLSTNIKNIDIDHDPHNTNYKKIVFLKCLPKFDYHTHLLKSDVQPFNQNLDQTSGNQKEASDIEYLDNDDIEIPSWITDNLFQNGYKLKRNTSSDNNFELSQTTSPLVFMDHMAKIHEGDKPKDSGRFPIPYQTYVQWQPIFYAESLNQKRQEIYKDGYELTVALLSDDAWFPMTTEGIGTNSIDKGINIQNVFKRQWHNQLVSTGSILRVNLYNRYFIFQIVSITESIHDPQNRIQHSARPETFMDPPILLTLQNLKHVRFVHKNTIQCFNQSYKQSLFPAYNQQLAQMKRWIEGLSTNAESYSRLGLPVPSSILVSGIFGIGKRTLVNHLANEISFFQYHIDCSSFIGEIEHRLQLVSKLKYEFQRAESMRPCLLILHNMDQLVSENQSKSLNTTSKSTVLQFIKTKLTEYSMNLQHNSQNTNQVNGNASTRRNYLIVIGLTENRQDLISRGFLHENHFVYQVELLIPNQNQRKEIIDFHLKNNRLLVNDETFNQEEDILCHFAEMTSGYTANDIVHLIQRMLESRAFKSISRSSSALHITKNDKTHLIMQEFMKAIQTFQPSHNSFQFTHTQEMKDSSKNNIGSVQGYTKIKIILENTIRLPFTHPTSFKRLGIDPKIGILLYGPTGCGKSLIVHSFIRAFNFKFVSLSSHQVFSKYFGDSEKVIREAFANARKASPSILFIDDIDNLGGKREEESQSGVQSRILSTLLNEMDGIEQKGHVLVIGCTNRPEALDEALLRPGRLDKHIYIDLPSESDREAIFKHELRKMKVNTDALSSKECSSEWRDILIKTEGLTCSDLVSLVRESFYHRMSSETKENYNLQERKAEDHTKNTLNSIQSILKMAGFYADSLTSFDCPWKPTTMTHEMLLNYQQFSLGFA